MPYASNRHDGVRTYFEDWGGGGSPILVYSGLADPIAASRRTGLVQALRGDYRLIFADHRGHGRSDKPHEVIAYALPTRADDAVAVLDELGIHRAHMLGFSWGARLGFALGEYAADRLRSLVLCGNQPYAWEARWPFVPTLTEALEVAATTGMQGFLDALERSFGDSIGEPDRSWTLENDALAIGAAWRSALAEGVVSSDLRHWTLPCLIYMAEGESMYDNAARAATEIPNARLLTLPGHSHLSAPAAVDQVLPAVRELLAEADALGDADVAADADQR
ncbi:MAG: alpha/beta fold hydrolase [Nocardioidaceae bacterium]